MEGALSLLTKRFAGVCFNLKIRSSVDLLLPCVTEDKAGLEISQADRSPAPGDHGRRGAGTAISVQSARRVPSSQGQA